MVSFYHSFNINKSEKSFKKLLNKIIWKMNFTTCVDCKTAACQREKKIFKKNEVLGTLNKIKKLKEGTFASCVLIPCCWPCYLCSILCMDSCLCCCLPPERSHRKEYDDYYDDSYCSENDQDFDY